MIGAEATQTAFEFTYYDVLKICGLTVHRTHHDSLWYRCTTLLSVDAAATMTTISQVPVLFAQRLTPFFARCGGSMTAMCNYVPVFVSVLGMKLLLLCECVSVANEWA